MTAAQILLKKQTASDKKKLPYPGSRLDTKPFAQLKAKAVYTSKIAPAQ